MTPMERMAQAKAQLLREEEAAQDEDFEALAPEEDSEAPPPEARGAEAEEREESAAPPRLPPPMSEAEKKEKREEAMLKRLQEELGEEEWEYLDESERKRLLAVARLATPQEDVDERIHLAFQQQEQQKQSQRFMDDLNGRLQPYQLDFYQLLNDKRFEKWLQSSRKRLAIFESAVRHRDAEALEDLGQLAESFLNEQTPGMKKAQTPSVGKSKSKGRGAASAVSEEEYEKAYANLRHPSRREKALAIIRQYETQGKK